MDLIQDCDSFWGKALSERGRHGGRWLMHREAGLSGFFFELFKDAENGCGGDLGAMLNVADVAGADAKPAS